MSTIEQAIQSRQDTVPAPAREFDREQWKAQKQQELEETFQILNDETMQLINDPTKFKAFLDLQAKTAGAQCRQCPADSESKDRSNYTACFLQGLAGARSLGQAR